MLCALPLLLVPLLLVAATASASPRPRLMVGFFDDPSLLWAPPAQVAANLRAAQDANATVVHVLANWAQIAPTRARQPLEGADPSYRLADLDALVHAASRRGLEVYLTISGTPRWANGGRTPNHPPRKPRNLKAFAHMLAARYDGPLRRSEPSRYWSIWNEPNLARSSHRSSTPAAGSSALPST